MAAVSQFSCSFPAIKNKIPRSRMGSLLPLFDFYFRHETLLPLSIFFICVFSIFCLHCQYFLFALSVFFVCVVNIFCLRCQYFLFALSIFFVCVVSIFCLRCDIFCLRSDFFYLRCDIFVCVQIFLFVLQGFLLHGNFFVCVVAFFYLCFYSILKCHSFLIKSLSLLGHRNFVLQMGN
jgi:hypothetical protein